MLRSHAEAYDKLYSRFDMKERPYGYSKAYVAWRCAQIRRPWKKWIKPTDLLLDIGGGFGNQAYHLPRGFNIPCQYINLDVSETMLKCSDGLKTVGVGERLPFRDETFDCVSCSEVLEHVSDKVMVLQEAYRVLKRNGIFFLSTPRTGWGESLREGWLGLFYGMIRIIRMGYLAHFKVYEEVQEDPSGVVDIPSDELWLREILISMGFTVLSQSRADNHLPIGENWFWRRFSDLLVNSQIYGHCVVMVCRKSC
jgi:ubiquinone/menaquinone biosynthesis C-methylase UbiE